MISAAVVDQCNISVVFFYVAAAVVSAVLYLRCVPFTVVITVVTISDFSDVVVVIVIY